MPARPRSCHCCLLGPSPLCYDLPHATTNHLCQPPVHPAVACHPAPRTLALQSLCCCAELPRLQTPLKLLFSDSCRASPPLAQLRPLERRGCLSQEDAIKGAWQTRWASSPAQHQPRHRLPLGAGERAGSGLQQPPLGLHVRQVWLVCRLGKAWQGQSRGVTWPPAPVGAWVKLVGRPQLAVQQHAAHSIDAHIMPLYHASPPARGWAGSSPAPPHLCCACRAGGT